jgi:DNA-binding CsgD family transcriptional regulator
MRPLRLSGGTIVRLGKIAARVSILSEMRRGRPPYPGVLTPREQQVLDLIRQGLTNEQIAQRLGISFSGARYHVAEILSKLGVSSRQEAALWSPQPAGARRFGFLGGLFGRITGSTLAKAAAGLAVAAGVAVLLALLFGIVAMGGRDEQLASIEVQWAEVELPAPQGTEMARPFQNMVPPGSEDLWRAYVVSGAGNPSEMIETRRYLTGLSWDGPASKVTFSFLTTFGGPVSNPSGSGGISNGLLSYERSSGRTGWERNYRPGIWVQGVSPDGSKVALLDQAQGKISVQQIGGPALELQGIPGSSPLFGGWAPTGGSFTFSVGISRLPNPIPERVSYAAELGSDQALVLGNDGAQWSADGEQLAHVQGQDLVILDLRRQTLQRIPTSGPVSPLRWNEDGNFVSAGDKLIDIRGGKVAYGTGEHSVLATGVSVDNLWQAFTLDPYDMRPCLSERLANETRLRSLRTGEEFALVDCSGDFYAHVEWLPNGRLVATGPNCWGCSSRSSRISMIEVPTGQVTPLTAGLEVGAAYHLSPDGMHILVTGSKLRVYTIDGVLEREMTPPDGLPVIAAAWSPDGSSFAYIVGPRVILV